MTMASNAGQSGASLSPALTFPTQAPSPPILFSFCHCDIEKGTGNHCKEKREKRGEGEKKGLGKEKMGVWTTHRGETGCPKEGHIPSPKVFSSGPPTGTASKTMLINNLWEMQVIKYGAAICLPPSQC